VKEPTGLKFKTTSRGVCVATLHYSAHPERGAEWVAINKPLYDEDKWNREQEISYETTVGTPVLRYDPSIHVRKLNHISGRVLRRGWDFGFRRPAVLVTQFNMRDQWMWLWGMVGHDETLKDFAARTFDICDAKFPPARDEAGKLMSQMWLEYCDPAGTQRSDKSDTTSIQDLNTVFTNRYQREPSVTFKKVSFEDGRSMILDQLKIRNNGEPGLLVDDDFEVAKDGFAGGYHYPDTRSSGAECEYPEDDGFYIHLFDSARYIANCIFEKEQPKESPADEGWERYYAMLNETPRSATGYM